VDTRFRDDGETIYKGRRTWPDERTPPSDSLDNLTPPSPHFGVRREITGADDTGELSQPVGYRSERKTSPKRYPLFVSVTDIREIRPTVSIKPAAQSFTVTSVVRFFSKRRTGIRLFLLDRRPYTFTP